jgi:hypothetical protein
MGKEYICGIARLFNETQINTPIEFKIEKG